MVERLAHGGVSGSGGYALSSSRAAVLEAPRLPIDACGDGLVAAMEAMICARPRWLR